MKCPTYYYITGFQIRFIYQICIPLRLIRILKKLRSIFYSKYFLTTYQLLPCFQPRLSPGPKVEAVSGRILPLMMHNITRYLAKKILVQIRMSDVPDSSPHGLPTASVDFAHNCFSIKIQMKKLSGIRS